MNGTDFFSEMAFINYTIPAWQMVLYVIIISLCMLTDHRKLSLITTYLFTLYWGFNLYWGKIIASVGDVPATATMYILFGIAHVVLTLFAFFRKE